MLETKIVSAKQIIALSMIHSQSFYIVNSSSQRWSMGSFVSRKTHLEHPDDSGVDGEVLALIKGLSQEEALPRLHSG